MESIFKIAVIAVIAALCAVVLKKNVPELGMILAILAGALIIAASLDGIEKVKGVMEALSDTAGLSPAILSPVIKTTGIAMITRIASEICKDAKEGALASCVEITGAIGALVVAAPLLESVISMIVKLL